MAALVPFASGNLPAYLKSFDIGNLNGDLLTHASSGFPVISIKGKVFTIVREGERTPITKLVDGEEFPAPSIDMVVIKANKNTSKVWYAKGFDGEAAKPDCYSNDGVRPDANVENPPSPTCAACPKNVFGSKLTDNGKKAKACSDSVRIAVATADRINDPYLLRVPAASIRNLGEFGSTLAKRGVGYQMVVTKISFDQAEATPKLKFQPVAFLDEATYLKVQEQAESDIVRSILGVSAVPAAAAPAPVASPAPAPKATKARVVADDEVAAVIERAAAPAPKAAPAVSEGALDLDNLSFDD